MRLNRLYHVTLPPEMEDMTRKANRELDTVSLIYIVVMPFIH